MGDRLNWWGENLSGSLQYEFGKRDFSAPAALTPIILNINRGDRLKSWSREFTPTFWQFLHKTGTLAISPRWRVCLNSGWMEMKGYLHTYIFHIKTLSNSVGARRSDPFSWEKHKILVPFAQNGHAAITEPPWRYQQTIQIAKNMMSKIQKTDFLKIAVMRP